MSKKIKPKSLIDNVEQDVPVADASGNAVVEDIQAVCDDGNCLVGNGTLTAEAKAKLEKYDALEATVLELTKEKQILEEKLAEYVEKLANVDGVSSRMEKLEDDNATMRKDMLELRDEAKDAAELRKKCKDLRDEADGYLVRISELTFENANLTCQLEEMSKRLSSNGNTHNQPQFALNNAQAAPGVLRKPNSDPYNPYKNNGYGTW